MPSADLLQAIFLLADATEADVQTALSELSAHLCTLPRGSERASDMKKDTMKAVSRLRPVAASLKKMEAAKRVSRNVKKEFEDLRTFAKHPHVVTTNTCLSCPYTMGYDFLPWMIFTSVPVHHESGGWYGMEFTPSVRRVEHYRFAGLLAQINGAFAAAVQAWRLEECSVWLESPDDALINRIVHLSPHVKELQIHPRWTPSWDIEPLKITLDAVTTISLRCSKLQKLLIRPGGPPGGEAPFDARWIVQLMSELPSLRELDLLHCHVDDEWALLHALDRYPEIAITVAACDPLWRESRKATARDRVRCVTCGDQVPAKQDVECKECCEVCPHAKDPSGNLQDDLSIHTMSVLVERGLVKTNGPESNWGEPSWAWALPIGAPRWRTMGQGLLQEIQSAM